jgi:hypothetical protein
MLELEHLERVARTFRNLADSAPTEEAKREMLAAADDYQRRADLRRETIKNVKNIAAPPT